MYSGCFSYLDSVARLCEFFCCHVIFSLVCAYFANRFQDLQAFCVVSLVWSLGRSQLLSQFSSHRNVLLHHQFDRIPILKTENKMGEIKHTKIKTKKKLSQKKKKKDKVFDFLPFQPLLNVRLLYHTENSPERTQHIVPRAQGQLFHPVLQKWFVRHQIVCC